MIKNIYIKNFQSHVDSKIEFTDGLNIITGSSDSGKSSVLRALLWVVNNRPSGDSIRNWNIADKETTSVSVLLPESVISKERRQGKAIYHLEKKPCLPGKGQIFEAFKVDVPIEIQEEFNLSEFNIQTQHQPYFLLNDSPGEIARQLNDLVGLSIIDVLFKNLNSKILSTDREVKSFFIEIDKLTNEIDSLSYLDVAGRELIKLEIKIEKQNKLEEETKQINEFVTNYLNIKIKLDSFNKVVKHEETVSEINDLIEIWEVVSTNELELTKEIASLSSVDSELSKLELILKQEKEYQKIKQTIDKFIELESKEEEIKNNVDKYKQCSKFIFVEDEKIVSKDAEYKKLLKQNKICPLCKRII